MEKDALCFCGSGQPHDSCHGHIRGTSMVAGLYRLQRAIDTETENQRADNELTFVCGPGCSECCSKCFCVSETEFVQILDWMTVHLSAEDFDRIIEKAHRQWELLAAEAPDIANRLKGAAPLMSLMGLNDISLPFPCVLLDNEGRCAIYDVRPLACRVHGTGFVNITENARPCSKLPPVLSAWDRSVNLTSFEAELMKFAVVSDGEHTVIRRPMPLFQYFHIIFKGNRTPADIRGTEFFRYLTEADEKEYIRALMDYFHGQKKQP